MNPDKNKKLELALSKYGNLNISINYLKTMIDSCNSSSALMIYGIEKSLHNLEKESLIEKEYSDIISDKLYELGEIFRDRCGCNKQNIYMK
jgi:hypothetical protein